MTHTRRVQILMDPADYDQLDQLAARQRVSVGELIRRAVRAQYLTALDERAAGFRAIAAMSLPSIDWEDARQIIEEAHDGGLP